MHQLFFLLRALAGSLASFDTSSIVNTEGVPLLEENEFETEGSGNSVRGNFVCFLSLTLFFDLRFLVTLQVLTANPVPNRDEGGEKSFPKKYQEKKKKDRINKYHVHINSTPSPRKYYGNF